MRHQRAIARAGRRSKRHDKRLSWRRACRVHIRGANAANDCIIDGIPVSTSAGGATFIPSLEAISDAKVEVDTYDAKVRPEQWRRVQFNLEVRLFPIPRNSLCVETRQTNWAANASSTTWLRHCSPRLHHLSLCRRVRRSTAVHSKLEPLDNTFFLGYKEGYRQAQPYTSSTNSYYLPTPSELAGDFSHDSVNGVPVTIFDPTQPFVAGERVIPVSFNGTANISPLV